MPDTTPTTAAPFRYVDEDDFHLSARLLPDFPSSRAPGMLSITIEGSDEPQSAHVPVGDLPRVLAGIAGAAGLVFGTTDQQPPPSPAGPCDEHGVNCRTADWPAPGTQPPVTAPAGTELRDRIAQALWSAGGPASAEDANVDAVLAVLPAPTNRAAAEQPADRRDRYAAALAAADGHDWATIAAQYPSDAAEYRAAADAVMAVADTEQAELRAEVAEVAEHRDTILRWNTDTAATAERDEVEIDSLRAELEAHRLALSDALGLGTGAPWDAIRDRAAELHTATADRGAALREAASSVESSDVAYNTEAATAALTNGGPFALIAFVQLAIGAHLRRMADEAQQPETEAAPDPADLNRQLSATCSCGHALRWHLPDCRKGSGHGCHCLSFTP